MEVDFMDHASGDQGRRGPSKELIVSVNGHNGDSESGEL